MTQKSKPRIVIDINKHGIRRETNLDAEYNKSIKKKEYKPRYRKNITNK